PSCDGGLERSLLSGFHPSPCRQRRSSRLTKLAPNGSKSVSLTARRPTIMHRNAPTPARNISANAWQPDAGKAKSPLGAVALLNNRPMRIPKETQLQQG